jgi:hypothetical protein
MVMVKAFIIMKAFTLMKAFTIIKAFTLMKAFTIMMAVTMMALIMMMRFMIATGGSGLRLATRRSARISPAQGDQADQDQADGPQQRQRAKAFIDIKEGRAIVEPAVNKEADYNQKYCLGVDFTFQLFVSLLTVIYQATLRLR